MGLPDYSKLYDAYYYAHGCGGRAYKRDEEWLQFFDSIAMHIARDIQPDSVLDAGCAMGFLIEGLRRRGIDAFGVDISEYAIQQVHPDIQPYCWVGSILDPFPQTYDLIVSIEVLEHLPKPEAELAVENFCRHSDAILFSSTPIDYKEPTHFNVQPPEYWAELFAKQGFFRDVDFSADFITPWAVLFRNVEQPKHQLVRNYERRLWYLQQDNSARRELNIEQRRELTRQDDVIGEQQKRIQEQVVALQERVDTIQDLQSQVMAAQQTTQLLESYARELRSLKGTMGWTVMKSLQSFRAWIAPPGGRREAMLQALWETALRVRAQGLAALFKREVPTSSMQRQKLYQFSAEDLVGGSAETPLRLVLYTTDTWSSACAVLRLVGPGRFASSGIEVLPGVEWERGPELFFPSQADAVVVQRDFPRHTVLYQQVLRWARDEGKPIVYELDDQLLELPEYHPEYAFFYEIRGILRQALTDADAAVASTLWLADYMRVLNPNTWVLPNYLDDHLWTLTTKPRERKQGPVIVGYMGGMTKTHLPDLALIAPVLRDLLQVYTGRVQLRFWGVCPPELEDMPNVEFVHETFPDYGAFARYFSQQDVDIFVAPLRENLFNRSKSWIKFLEYSALGVCGVYSRIAPYEGIVVHGKNGFLASTPEEWKVILTSLIEDAQLRRSVGDQAQDTVRRMLLSNHVHEWGSIYRAALASVSASYRSEA